MLHGTSAATSARYTRSSQYLLAFIIAMVYITEISLKLGDGTSVNPTSYLAVFFAGLALSTWMVGTRFLFLWDWMVL
jgi:hypothetical protein